MRRTLALLAALTLAACGGNDAPAAKKSPTATTPPASTAPASEPAASAQGATAPASAAESSSQSAGAASASKETKPPATGARVSFSASGGRAHWVGEIPAPKTLAFSAATAEPCHHDGPMDTLDRSLLVDAGGGVANVVIEVEVDGAAPPPAAEPFQIDQKGCAFLPHVSLVPAGAEVRFGNSDPFTHNVNVVARRNDGMNVMVDTGGTRNARYEKSDQIQLKCDVHPWMGAWVYVSDAPVHALSAADGSFALPPLPQGTHKVACWHESLGKASGTLTVGADGAIAELELALGKRR